MAAGPGGLATAINLAVQGFAVTVVDKDDRVGGRMKGLPLAERQHPGPAVGTNIIDVKP